MPLVLKSEEQQIVYGEVYSPMRPDAQGEYMTAVEIRKMAHEFLRSGKMSQIDLMHGNELVKGASVVESFIADSDPRFLPDSWVIGVHVPDSKLWSSIKKGDINGFSMEALVSRHDTDVEIEIPPVVTGLTSKHDDGHEHKFFVTYDEKGEFKGGVTDVVNGHSHTIVAGTHTQPSDGHTHRFCSVDTVRILG
jgi:hypothetical protein